MKSSPLQIRCLDAAAEHLSAAATDLVAAAEGAHEPRFAATVASELYRLARVVSHLQTVASTDRLLACGRHVGACAHRASLRTNPRDELFRVSTAEPRISLSRRRRPPRTKKTCVKKDRKK